MDIRIDMDTEGAGIVLHVAGRLVGDVISQLTDVCEPIEGRYVLDLSKLMFVDDEGAEVIRTLRESGADIRGPSPFIKLLIDGETG
jgi:anti-anti-sigma regulatory factor